MPLELDLTDALMRIYTDLSGIQVKDWKHQRRQRHDYVHPRGRVPPSCDGEAALGMLAVSRLPDKGRGEER